MIALAVLVAVVIALCALGAVAAKRENARRADGGGEATLFGDAGGDGGASGCHDGGMGGCDVGGHH